MQAIAHASLVVLFGASLIGSPGCAGGPDEDRSMTASPGAVEPLRVEDLPAAEPSDADRMQRDIDDFLARRGAANAAAERGGPNPQEGLAAPTGPGAGEGAGAIAWNEPAAGAGPTEATQDAPAAPDVAARPEEPIAPVAPTPVSITPGTPAIGPGATTDRIGTLLVDLSSELWEEAAYADMPLRELLLIAATSMVRPDRAIDPEAVPGLTEGEREVLARFQAFFAELGTRLDGSDDPDVVIEDAVTSLRDALRDEPDLSIATARLGTRVRGFGDVDAFATNDEGRYVFLAHTEQQAIVYLELDGFASEADQTGMWHTEVSQRLVIYADHTGFPVWREDWQTVVDRAANRRRDFFTVQVVTLPSQLGVGRYQLKIHVRDETNDAEAETALEFELVADPKMLGRRD